MPEDFAQRLDRLKQSSGLTWDEFADTDTRVVPTHFPIAEGGRVTDKNGRFGYEPLA